MKTSKSPGNGGIPKKIEIPNIMLATAQIIDEIDRKSTTGIEGSEMAKKDKVPKKLTQQFLI